MVDVMPAPTMIQSISEAKAHFSAIVDSVSGGEVFVICRAGKPLVQMSAYVPPKKTRRIGAMKGTIQMADDFDEWPPDMMESLGMK